MEEEKIDRILKLVDMLEVTDENRDDIAKVKKLIEQKKYAEMLEVLKKVTSKNETKIKEDNRTILFRNEEKEEKEENKEEKEPIEEDDDVNSEEDEKAQMEKLLDNLEQEKEDEDYEYPKKLSNKKLEEVYISLLLANPKAISMYYIEKKDCYFESALLLNIYKSILFTEGEAYAPQVAKDDFNYAKENYKIFQSKKKLLEEGRESRQNFEKVYVELRKLFEIRKGYTTNPIKETKKQIEEIVDYELYDRMTIQEVKDAIVQITTTEKFKRSILSTNVTDFLLSGENNLNSGLTLPFPILSSVFKGIRKGETMSYAMPSNSGKSRFTIDIATYIAYKHKKKVLIVSNEMSEEKMKLCLITTIVNNKEIQELHGYKLRITEGEILEFKYKADQDKNVETDENGYVLRYENESLEKFTKRLLECSSQFRDVIAVTNWIQTQKDNQIFFVNITDHTNDELEKIILNYYYKEKIEYMFYDTLKPDTENIGNSEELKKTATILSNLAQNLNIFIGSSLQLTESDRSPLNLDVNDLAACRTVKEVLDTLCLIKQIHNDDLGLYEYSYEEVPTECFDLERSKNPDVRYYACVVDKNRAGAKPKVVFRLNLAYNEWEELGYLRLKTKN
jgi:hypothetical protein